MYSCQKEDKFMQKLGHSLSVLVAVLSQLSREVTLQWQQHQLGAFVQEV